MTGRGISCGRDLTCVPDLAKALELYGEKGYDFIAVPIIHPRYKRDYFSINPKRPGPLTRSDKVIKISEWTTLIVAKLSPWIHLDSQDSVVRRNSEKAFFEEISLAVHLGTSAILLHVSSIRCENLARCIKHILLQNHHHMIWVHIPMTSAQMLTEGIETQMEEVVEPWEIWNKLRTLCGNCPKLGLALEVCPNMVVPLYKMNRWCGEPVKLVIVPTNTFIPNRKGYPVLSRSMQSMFERFFKLNAQFLLTGASRVDYDIKTYQQYLDHIYQHRPNDSEIESFSKGYEDYLQSPLQPLMDNLDSQTYDIFEKDPFKYLQYEKAIERALTDRVSYDQKETKTV